MRGNEREFAGNPVRAKLYAFCEGHGITFTALRFTARQGNVVDINAGSVYPHGLPLQDELIINGIRTGRDSWSNGAVDSRFAEDEHGELLFRRAKIDFLRPRS